MMPRIMRKVDPKTAAVLLAWRPARIAWSRSKDCRKDFLMEINLAEHPSESDSRDRSYIPRENLGINDEYHRKYR